MELTPTQARSSQTLTVSAGKSDRNAFTVGQQVSAKVLAVNSSTKEISLSINNVTLNAKSNAPVIPGQSLKLTVVQSGKETVLQVQRDVVEKTIIQQTLRESLPKQQTMDETLKILQQVTKEGKNSGLSEKIIQFTQRFIQQIPNASQLSQAQGLKEAILRSGIFLENALTSIASKNTLEKITLDFKLSLLQLKSLLLNEKNNLLRQEVSANKQLAAETKTPNTTKQMQHREEEKRVAGKEQRQTLNQQVKNALEQAVIKITQQQKAIGHNLSRLLNTSPINTLLSSQKPDPKNSPSPSANKKTITQPSLKDALAFTANTQKPNKSELNFARFGNLTDLLEAIAKQVDSGISRTQLHQLNSLLDPETGKLSWSMEIPVKIAEDLHAIHLHLEKEPGADEDSEPVLTVSIALDLKYLGPVYAKITLITENVGVIIWAERETTYQLTQNYAEDLQANLNKSGLKPENINFHHGQPPHNPVLKKTQKSALLDIRV